MREKVQQTVLDLPSPSSGGATDENSTSESESPVVSRIRKVDTTLRKKVNFLSPPKWRVKHSIAGSSKSSASSRPALKTLQSNKLNSKLLVGRGSPRIPTVGKGKGSKLKQTVITCTLPSSSKQNRKQPEAPKVLTVEQSTQTEIGTFSLDYKMCTEDEPPAEYWHILAEQRREALAETLKENKELYAEIDCLKEHIEQLKGKVNDLNYFAMMYKIASKEDN